MPTTDISICNAALLLVGAEEIASFSDSTREAALCNALYATTRDSLLQGHPWRFSMKQAALTALGTDPLYGFTNKYQLPSDFLRAIGVESGHYAIFEDTLHSDEPDVTLTYQFQPDEEDMPAWFVRVLELKMAEILSVALTQDPAKGNRFAEQAAISLQQARTIDAQQQTAAALREEQFPLVHVRK